MSTPEVPTATPPRILRRSRHVATFAHMGEVYAYHDLYGYILKMSPDLAEFLASFADPIDAAEVCRRWAEAFGGEDPAGFVNVFAQFACLVAPDEDELAGLWGKVPVKGRWNVWSRGADGRVTLYTAWGHRPLQRHLLDAEDTAIWDAIDGQARASTLAERFGAERVAAFLVRMVQVEIQALKLSAAPLSAFKTRPDMMPPYLTSTMPYLPWDPARDPRPVPFAETFSPEQYYKEEIADADAQFDHQETTLSHLLRVPHPALGGRTYGATLVEALAGRGLLPEARIRVLEIGGGLGFVARAVTEALVARGLEVTYHMLELSPALAAAQRERTAGLPITVHDGDALGAWPAADYDLLLSNEMIGDLPAARFSRAQLRLDDDLPENEWGAHLRTLGAAGELITRFDIPIGDAPDPMYLNLGAIQLVERAWQGLAPGGVAVITEFGEMSRWPRLSTHLDHPEISVHFGHLSLVGRAVGFDPQFAFVIDLIDLARTHEGLATTRSHFRALQAMLADHGVTLEKIGYTRDMVAELLAGKVELDRVGELRFDKIEDRLMGLVPHEFKALLLVKPDPSKPKPEPKPDPAPEPAKAPEPDPASEPPRTPAPEPAAEPAPAPDGT